MSFFGYGCVAKSNVDKKLIYSTLNEIILHDSIFAHIICGKFEPATIPDDIRKEFFPNDNNFIQEQVKKSKNISVDTGLLYFYSRKRGKLVKSVIDTTCSMNIFYRLTFPIFSKDLQTAVIGVTEDCSNCLLGGWGFKAVYKRQNDKWVIVKKFEGWIS